MKKRIHFSVTVCYIDLHLIEDFLSIYRIKIVFPGRKFFDIHTCASKYVYVNVYCMKEKM